MRVMTVVVLVAIIGLCACQQQPTSDDLLAQAPDAVADGVDGARESSKKVREALRLGDMEMAHVSLDDVDSHLDYIAAQHPALNQLVTQYREVKAERDELARTVEGDSLLGWIVGLGAVVSAGGLIAAFAIGGFWRQGIAIMIGGGVLFVLGLAGPTIAEWIGVALAWLFYAGLAAGVLMLAWVVYDVARRGDGIPAFTGFGAVLAYLRHGRKALTAAAIALALCLPSVACASDDDPMVELQTLADEAREIVPGHVFLMGSRDQDTATRLHRAQQVIWRAEVAASQSDAWRAAAVESSRWDMARLRGAR